MNKQHEFNIDINITKRCTMNCDYCFAVKPGHSEEMKDTKDVIIFLHKFLNSDFFKNNYEMLTVNLWGGEPTMRMDHVTAICNEFENDSRVRLFIFTNGYTNMTALKQLLKRFKGRTIHVHPKLCIQISYDGLPIHDIKRRSGKHLTSIPVRNFIKWCDENSVAFVIKSTVTPDTFKYMFEAYKDIKQLYKECTISGAYRQINYFPTIDYYDSENSTPENHERYSNDLQNSLTDIATVEVEKVKFGHFFFAWFNPSRAKCTAGKHSMAIDVDGLIYTCHGCMYDQYPDDSHPHQFTHIENPDWEGKIKSTVFHTDEYMSRLTKDPEDCKNCPVEFCLRCNHGKFQHSQKQLYLDKWFDFTSQPYLCDYYKINNIVKGAMFKVAAKRAGGRI